MDSFQNVPKLGQKFQQKFQRYGKVQIWGTSLWDGEETCK
jgi:hypothetical protein